MEGNQLKDIGMFQLLQETQFPEILIMMQNALVLSSVVAQVMCACRPVAVRLNIVSIERWLNHDPALVTAGIFAWSGVSETQQWPHDQRSLQQQQLPQALMVETGKHTRVLTILQEHSMLIVNVHLFSAAFTLYLKLKTNYSWSFVKIRVTHTHIHTHTHTHTHTHYYYYYSHTTLLLMPQFVSIHHSLHGTGNCLGPAVMLPNMAETKGKPVKIHACSVLRTLHRERNSTTIFFKAIHLFFKSYAKRQNKNVKQGHNTEEHVHTCKSIPAPSTLQSMHMPPIHSYATICSQTLMQKKTPCQNMK